MGTLNNLAQLAECQFFFSKIISPYCRLNSKHAAELNTRQNLTTLSEILFNITVVIFVFAGNLAKSFEKIAIYLQITKQKQNLYRCLCFSRITGVGSCEDSDYFWDSVWASQSHICLCCILGLIWRGDSLGEFLMNSPANLSLYQASHVVGEIAEAFRSNLLALLWIRIQIVSIFSNFVDLDPHN